MPRAIHPLRCHSANYLMPMNHTVDSNSLLNPLARLKQQLPPHVWLLLAFYFIGSLVHFAHNAQYIAFYPNMPAWLTPGDVYLVWLAISAFAVAGLLMLSLGWTAIGILLVAVYGALGLDGLGHYWLALCSEHTLAANLTIGAEAASGLLLMLASLRWLWRWRR